METGAVGSGQETSAITDTRVAKTVRIARTFMEAPNRLSGDYSMGFKAA